MESDGKNTTAPSSSSGTADDPSKDADNGLEKEASRRDTVTDEDDKPTEKLQHVPTFGHFKFRPDEDEEPKLVPWNNGYKGTSLIC